MITRLFFSLLVTTIALPVAVEAQTYDLERGSLVRVHTQDGSRLEGHVSDGKADVLLLRDGSGAPIRVAWDEVYSVERYAQNPRNEAVGAVYGFILGTAIGGFTAATAYGANLQTAFHPLNLVLGIPFGLIVGIPVGGSIGARQGQRWVDVPPGTTGRSVGLKIRF